MTKSTDAKQGGPQGNQELRYGRLPAWVVQNGWLAKMGQAAGVYMSLIFHKNQGSSRCFPSIATIARETGSSERSVIRQVQKLERLGLIWVNRAHKKANEYTIRELPLGDKTDISRVTKTTSLGDKTDISRVTNCHTNKRILTKELTKEQQQEEIAAVKIGNLGEEEEKRILDWWKQTTPKATISPGDKSMLAGLTLLQVQGFHAKLPWIQNLGCLLKKSTEAADREERLRKQSFWESHTRWIRMTSQLAEMTASQRDAFFARYRDLREDFERKMAQPDFRIFFETMEAISQREAEEYRQKSANRTTAEVAAAPDTPRLRLTKPAVKFEYQAPTEAEIKKMRQSKLQQLAALRRAEACTMEAAAMEAAAG